MFANVGQTGWKKRNSRQFLVTPFCANVIDSRARFFETIAVGEKRERERKTRAIVEGERERELMLIHLVVD